MSKFIFFVFALLTLSSAAWFGYDLQQQDDQPPEKHQLSLQELEKKLAQILDQQKKKEGSKTSLTSSLASSQGTEDLNLSPPKPDPPEAQGQAEAPPVPSTQVEPEEIVLTEELSPVNAFAEPVPPVQTRAVKKDEPTDEQIRDIQQRLSATINQMEKVLSGL